MLRLEAFVDTVYDTALALVAEPAPTRCLLLKLDGQPTAKLQLDSAEQAFAPLGPEVSTGSIQFEALLLARAAGSWVLGPVPGSVSAGRPQQHLQLHVIYASTAAESSCSSGVPSVLGVGRLEIPLPPACPAGAGVPPQPPIQLEALRNCELCCPVTGRATGSVSLAARLSMCTQASAAPSFLPNPAPGLSRQQQSCASTTVRVDVACRGGYPLPLAVAAASPGADSAQRQRRHASTQASPAKAATQPSAALTGRGAAEAPLPLGALPILAYPSFMMPALLAPGLVGASPALQPVALYSAWQALPMQQVARPAQAAAVLQPPQQPPCSVAQPNAIPEASTTQVVQGTAAPSPQPGNTQAGESSSWGLLQEEAQGRRDLPGSPLCTPRERGTPRFHSPLKPKPKPLQLEHRLEEVPRSRSPARRHSSMVKSALRGSQSFYCPGCLAPFLRLPHSPRAGGLSQAREASAWCWGSCRHCRSALAAVDGCPGGGTGAGLPSSSPTRSPSRAADSLACAVGSSGGSPVQQGSMFTGPVGANACEAAAARAPAHAYATCKCCGSMQASSGGSQPAADVSHAPSNPKCAPPPASPGVSCCPEKGGLICAEAAAFAQLLANLNLTSNWRAALLNSLGTAAVGTATGVCGAAGTGAAAAAPRAGEAAAAGGAFSRAGGGPASLVPPLPPAATASSPAAVPPREAGGGGRSGGRAGDKGSSPRRRLVHDAEASCEGATAAGVRSGGRLRSHLGKRQEPREAAAAEWGASASHQGEAPGGHGEQQQDAATKLCRQRGHSGSMAGGAAPKARTLQDIVSRNQQLLQQLQAARASGEAVPEGFEPKTLSSGMGGSGAGSAQQCPREVTGQSPALIARGALTSTASERSRGSHSSAPPPPDHPTASASPCLSQSPPDLIGAAWRPTGPAEPAPLLVAAASEPSGDVCQPQPAFEDAAPSAGQEQSQGEGESAENMVARVARHWEAGEPLGGPSAVIDSTIGSHSEAAAGAAAVERGWEEEGAGGEEGGGATEMSSGALGGGGSVPGSLGAARIAGSEECYEDDFEPASDED